MKSTLELNNQVSVQLCKTFEDKSSVSNLTASEQEVDALEADSKLVKPEQVSISSG